MSITDLIGGALASNNQSARNTNHNIHSGIYYSRTKKQSNKKKTRKKNKVARLARRINRPYSRRRRRNK